jgi:ketosteroid isomerase-like protein
VVAELLARIAAGPSEALADLYAPDAIVELPFARPGGLRLTGRAEIRAHFGRAAAGSVWFTPVDVVLYETHDPEVVVAEYDARIEAPGGGHAVVVSNVQIVTVRAGLIARSRDFHDHQALTAESRAAEHVRERGD